uniref:Uncharacterized protein n=1 Tax=Strigamia maritima TaxID=126957 RepID=T1JCI9_STRMM
MFSFHKPKIYRSNSGCCICKAKSSSSRFTDSKKYEPEFELCFKISEKRSGEICNACVLLVKRWKKLPPGTTRDWQHVVDARAGPGTKSLMKFKSKSKLSKRPSKKNKIKRIVKRCTTPPPPPSPGGLSDDITVGEECLSDRSTYTPSPIPSDGSEDSYPATHLKRKIMKKRMKTSRRNKCGSSPKKCSQFVDLSIWKKVTVCCGIVFTCPGGGLIIDETLFHPCQRCKKEQDSGSNSEFEAAPSSSSETSLSANDSSSQQPVKHQDGIPFY